MFFIRSKGPVIHRKYYSVLQDGFCIPSYCRDYLIIVNPLNFDYWIPFRIITGNNLLRQVSCAVRVIRPWFSELEKNKGKKDAGYRMMCRCDVNTPARIFRVVMIHSGKQPFSVGEKWRPEREQVQVDQPALHRTQRATCFCQCLSDIIKRNNRFSYLSWYMN